MLDLASFEQSFDQFQSAFLDYHEPKRIKELARITEENKKLAAMKTALETMAGISIMSVKFGENEAMIILLSVKSCEVRLKINNEKRLESIEIISEEFNWINTTQILSDAQQFPAPHDLRTAVFYISASQTAKELFAQDCIKLKKNCLVNVINPFVIKFSVKNGLSFLVEASQYYSKVLNSVKVVEVTIPATLEISLNITEEEIKHELNNSCFTNLQDMYQAISTKFC